MISGMIRTKHLLVGVVLIVIIFVVLVIIFWSSIASNSTGLIERQEITFHEGEEGFAVSADTENNWREERRTTLLSKLGLWNGDQREEGGGASGEEAEINEPEDDAVAVSEGYLPLGDQKAAVSPTVGYIYQCQQVLHNASAPAPVSWIKDEAWVKGEKVFVDGNVRFDAEVNISIVEGARVITTNGLPNHVAGIFPILLNDDAYRYSRDAAAIAEQYKTIQLPIHPIVASMPSCLSAGMIGVGLNGVALFGGLTDDGFDASAYGIFDQCNGHTDETGEYHYHSESSCLVSSYYEGAPSTLVGYALDGFGIFSSVESGRKITNDDLDACHGHTHLIPWDGEMVNMYHYHMTDEYPYTLGCFKGTPVAPKMGLPESVLIPDEEVVVPPPQQVETTTPSSSPTVL